MVRVLLLTSASGEAQEGWKPPPPPTTVIEALMYKAVESFDRSRQSQGLMREKWVRQ